MLSIIINQINTEVSIPGDLIFGALSREYLFQDESDMLSVNVQGTTNVMLDQLEPYTGYSIQVMAANRKGLGPPSARIICTTTEAKPDTPGLNLFSLIYSLLISHLTSTKQKPVADLVHI